jgi:type II secretory pathway component GspD/PulD (secretin)
MRSQLYFPHTATVPLSSVFLCILLLCPLGLASAHPSETFSVENADIQTVIKRVAAVTGITFIFDPEQVKGKITVLSPKNFSPAEALRLLEAALALHGYSLLNRAQGMLIVPVEQVAPKAIAVKVVRLNYARAGELAYTLSWVAPPGVRIVPYFPTNSLIISGPPAMVDELVDIVR